VVAVAFYDPAAIALPEIGNTLGEILLVNAVVDEKPLNRQRDVNPRDVASRFSSLQDSADDENDRTDLQKISLSPNWPYRGKFDCRITDLSMVPNSAFVALFSYCRSS